MKAASIVAGIAALFAASLAEAIEADNYEQQREQIEASRVDVNAFAEYAFTDTDTGAYFIQAPHHTALQATFMSTDPDRQRTVTWFPVEHGKTEQIKVALLWLLGTYPDRTYAYISSDLTSARKLVGVVKREIEHNERVRRVFPKLEPERGVLTSAVEVWGNEAIRVRGAKPNSKDPSLAAYGVDGKISGSRVNGAFIDNVCDRTNTRSKVERQSKLELIDEDIESRVYKTGFAHVTDTSWHVNDPPHVLAEREGWISVKYDAHKDVDGNDGPLWPLQWSWERLEKKRKTTSSVTYDRTMRNIPVTDSVRYFKSAFVDAAIGKVPWYRTYATDTPEILCTGVDLATGPGAEHDDTAFVTAKDNKHRMQVLNILTDQIEASEILHTMFDIFQRFHWPVLRAGGLAHFQVENNGSQVFIEQLMRNPDIVCKVLGATHQQFASIRVSGFTTGKNKRDVEFGIPSIAADFEMGRILLPEHHEVTKLKSQLEIWTPSEAQHTGDTVMSLWFAREGLRRDVPCVSNF